MATSRLAARTPAVAALIAAWLNRRIAYFILCLGSLIVCQLIIAKKDVAKTPMTTHT